MSAAWPKVTFGDAPLQIIDGDRGSNYPKQDEFHNEGHCLFLNTGNVTKSGFDFGNCQFINEQKDNLLRKGKLSREDVIMTTRGTIGNVGYFNRHVPFENIRINSGMVIFRADQDKLRPIFLYQYLRSSQFNKQVNSLRSGAAQPQLPIRDIKVIEIPLPSIDQQEAIAELSSKYDDLIDNNNRRISLLEEAAQELYKEWFVRFRFPGHEHVKIVDGVPERWAPSTASEALEINPGIKVERGKEITYVPMSALSTIGMNADRADFEVRRKHTNVKFQRHDTLFARITPCLENGKTTFVNFLGQDEVACGSTEFIVLRGRKVSPYYTYLLAREESFRGNAIKSMIGSSGRQRVQASCFDRYVLPLPPDIIMGQFDEAVQNIFTQIEALTNQNFRLAEARDILLPKLMSGEIAV